MKSVLKLAITMVFLTLLISACGNGSDEPAPGASTQEPPAAGQTGGDGPATTRTEAEMEATEDKLQARLQAAQDRLAEQRKEYERKMSRTLEDWQARIDDFRRQVEQDNDPVTDEIWRSLDSIWLRVKLQWERFEDPAQDAWHENRAALERELSQLERVWKEAAATQPTDAPAE